MSVNRRDLHREQRAHAATRKELARVEKAARVVEMNRRDLHREQKAHAATRKELARVEKAARVVEMKWQGMVSDLQDQLAKAQKRKPAKPKKVKPVERIVHVSNPADRVEIEALKAEVDRLTRELEAKA